jgi:hydroxymethylglutaryl-CoA synthase
MTVGFRAVGAYAPRLRIDDEAFREAWGQFHGAGVGSKAVQDAEEDAVTMAYEAATRALRADDASGADISFLAFVTSNPPVEEDLTARLGAMLGVPSDATHQFVSGSTRAGTRAIRAALDADLDPNGGVGLVVVADCPKGPPDAEKEHAAGAGAAGFILATDGDGAVLDSAEYASPYPGERFRERGSDRTRGLGVTHYDRQAFTETLGRAVDRVDAGDLDAAAVQAPNGKLPYRAAGAIGVSTDEIRALATVHDLGDGGAASTALGLAKGLIADDIHRLLVASYGSGAGADVLVVECPGTLPGIVDLGGELTLSYAEYLRRRGEITSGPPSGGGAYVSLPSWRLTLPQRYCYVAGRCPACDALNFPPEGACSVCYARVEFDAVSLPGTGTVEAVTTISQGGAPPEFAEQQAKSGDFAAAIVAFDGPGGDRDHTVSTPAQVTDCEPGALDVSDRVESTIRRIYTQEGVTRYGFKIRPTSEL